MRKFIFLLVLLFLANPVIKGANCPLSGMGEFSRIISAFSFFPENHSLPLKNEGKEGEDEGMEFYKVQRGDTLSGIAAKLDRDLQELIEINKIDNPGLIHPGQKIYLNTTGERWDTGEEIRFIWPTRGTITSDFGPRSSGFHYGIDLANSPGTPIVAAADGYVIFSDYSPGFGKLIILQHKGDFNTYYAHNLHNAVKENQKVEKGQIIAFLGNSGKSTGPHLHFEIRRNNQPVDPLRFLYPIPSKKI